MVQEQLHYFVMAIKGGLVQCTSSVDIKLVGVHTRLLVSEQIFDDFKMSLE